MLRLHIGRGNIVRFAGWSVGICETCALAAMSGIDREKMPAGGNGRHRSVHAVQLAGWHDAGWQG